MFSFFIYKEEKTMTWMYVDELEREYRNDLKDVRRRLEELKNRRDIY